MYIPEFWAGVLVTVGIEIIIILLMSFIGWRKDKHDESNEYKSGE